MTAPIPEHVAERAATKYDVVGECRISTYSTGSHGYAQVGWREAGKTETTTAHRAAWTYHFGPIPDGITVDHKDHCNRKCVNPAHLRLLTNVQNAKRNRPGLDYPLDWTCWRNHGAPRNVRGACVECNRIAQAKYNHKRREKV